MSSVYPEFIKGLNPVYYWRLNSFASSTTSTNSFSGWATEEMHKAANKDSNGTDSKSQAYYLNSAMPAGTPNPFGNSGPIAGGDSNGLAIFDTFAPAGPRMLQTGTTGSFTHAAPVGRNHPFSIVMWFKTIPAMTSGSTTTEHFLTSSADSNNNQHFMVAERQQFIDSVDSNELKIKTRSAAGTQNAGFSGVYNKWNSTLWTMFTLTSVQGTTDATTTAGMKTYINGKFHWAKDSQWSVMLDSPAGVLTYMYLMSAYNVATTAKPGACAEVAMWDKVLSASQIGEIYYHAVSPSPARVRGGLHRQLGRLV
jgi:hypothetical protein